MSARSSVNPQMASSDNPNPLQSPLLDSTHGINDSTRNEDDNRLSTRDPNTHEVSIMPVLIWDSCALILGSTDVDRHLKDIRKMTGEDFSTREKFADSLKKFSEEFGKYSFCWDRINEGDADYLEPTSHINENGFSQDNYQISVDLQQSTARIDRKEIPVPECVRGNLENIQYTLLVVSLLLFATAFPLHYNARESCEGLFLSLF